MTEVHYDNKRIERLCTDDHFAKKEIGTEGASHLRRRVAELRGVVVVEDLLMTTGRWEELGGDRSGQWSARLGRNWRLIVEAVKGDVSVTVIEVVDYH